MSKTTHTRGPWNLQSQESYDGRATYRFYRVFDNNLNAICCEEYGAHNDGGLANMRLIAAAPCLLEALEWVTSCDVAMKHLDDATYCLVHAAIARAKGEA